MKYSRGWIALCCLAVFGAAVVADSSGKPWNGKVQSHGALRAIFHEGATDSAVDVSSLLPNSDLYGVGALAGLDGEVTIVGGVVHRSSAQAETVVTTTLEPGAPLGAALLVTSEVNEWRTVNTATPVAFGSLDAHIAALAEEVGLDPGGRFPFLIQGVVEKLRWHVIDGTRLSEGASSHADHQAASVRGEQARGVATLVGFYSAVDQGVFTHRGSRTHVHAVIEDPAVTGHVDHVVLPAGTAIRFPVVSP